MSKKPAATKNDAKDDTKTLPAANTGAMVVMSDEVPDYLRTDTARGSENVGTDDLVIPRLELVQSLSPQRKKNDAKYIEGAEEGMMFNNVTGELFSDALIVPVAFKPEFLVWKDRKKSGGQGGFRGSFATKEEAEIAIRDLAESDLEIVYTHQHIALIIDPQTGKVDEIAISMGKSKMKVSKRLNSLVRMLGGDRFSRVYKIRAIMEKNQRNEDYYNFSIEQAGFPSKELYLRAEALYETISKGGVSINRDGMDEAGGAASEPGGEY